ncbi:MAG: hypothetical protein ACFFCW_28635 [Candidatus Hodarchaeota archaeon]
MKNPQMFAKLIDQMDPAFIEVKGAVHVGFAQKRIKKTAMPYFEDIITFTNELQRYLGGYKQISQKRASLISILSNGKHPTRIPGL